MKTEFQLQKRIRIISLFFITSLVISGVTAFPLQTELTLISHLFESSREPIVLWIAEVTEALDYMNTQYSFLSYGTDWLAFAHIIISIFFIGVYKDPVRNLWITQTGIIACVLIIPLALIAGYARNIPFVWQLIDISFGVFGVIPLIFIHKYTQQLISNKFIIHQTQTC